MSDQPNFQPLPDDPSAATIGEMFDATAEWLVARAGDYQAAAVQTFQRDGGGFQELIAIEWPARHNHTDDEVVVRLMIHPEDAIGLADVLNHTARWLVTREMLRKRRDG